METQKIIVDGKEIEIVTKLDEDIEDILMIDDDLDSTSKENENE
jgi:hypothetical protein